MDRIAAYLMRILGAAVICGCVKSILPGKGMISRMIGLLCGLFLAFAVISPFAKLQIETVVPFGNDLHFSSDHLIAQGESQSMEAYREGIISRTEAYILDKAASLAPDLLVEVTLSEDSLSAPCEVTLIGEVSPYTKTLIRDMLETDLNIPREAQKWIN